MSRRDGYSAAARALLAGDESPCHRCPNEARCATENVACDVFARWVTAGRKPVDLEGDRTPYRGICHRIFHGGAQE